MQPIQSQLRYYAFFKHEQLLVLNLSGKSHTMSKGVTYSHHFALRYLPLQENILGFLDWNLLYFFGSTEMCL